MKCPIHPRYQGLKKPTACCLYCWVIYHSKHPKEAYSGADVQAILGAGMFALDLFHKEIGDALVADQSEEILGRILAKREIDYPGYGS